MGTFVEPDITLSESEGLRYLHFGTEWVQGAMCIARPDALPIEYTRKMMGWLLFLRARQSVLQLGLGAASLTRYSLEKLPDSVLSVVEPSRRVIQAARQWFHLPAQSRRFRLFVEDGEAFVCRCPSASYGVLQVDVYDAQAQGPVLDSTGFYQQCRRILANPGVMAVNLFGSHESFAINLRRIQEVFERRVVLLPQCESGNIVALAFNGPAFVASWAMLTSRATLLERKFELEAPEWVTKLRASTHEARDGLVVGAAGYDS